MGGEDVVSESWEAGKLNLNIVSELKWLKIIYALGHVFVLNHGARSPCLASAVPFV